MSVRKEVRDFTRCCDVLLNVVERPLMESERELLNAYLARMQEKLELHRVQGS
jgi:hypothetical protein